MEEIDDESVHLVITSPPYNVGMEYEGVDDRIPHDQYAALLNDVIKECYRVLVPGGRIAVNVANLHRKPYRPLVNLLEAIVVKYGFVLKGEIIWQKMWNARSTAWGSYLKASNPAIRDTHEYIIIAQKGYEAMKPPRPESEMTITATEFAKYTNSIWDILPSKDTTHPAVFPEEIPKRLIKLFTWTDCTVLDPFAGSGTTLHVARELGRRGIGYELSEEYVRYILKRATEGVQMKLEDFWNDYFAITDS